MRRTLSLIAATAAATLLAATLATASGGGAKLQLRKTKVGTILVNNRGFTVYAFTRDRTNKDNCAKISGCMGAWPPVTTTGKVAAGPGVHARLIGTIKLSGAPSK